MRRSPTLKTAMTPFPYSVELSAPLAQAQQLMEEHNVRHLPVTQGHALVGLLTDRDVKAALAARSEASTADDLTVARLCISEAYVVDLNEPLDTVLLTMAHRHIGSAIVTREGILAGMFTSVDACRCFGEYLREHRPRTDGDAAA